MAISESIVLALISQWKERLEKGTQTTDYKCALGECIYDLQKVLDTFHNKEILAEIPVKVLPKQVEESFYNEEADRIAYEIEVYNEEH